MSGSEGRCERECSGGEGLLGGDGEVDRPVGGRGAADRDPGGRSADLPSEPPAGPSVWKTERQCLSALGKKSNKNQLWFLGSKYYCFGSKIIRNWE